MFNPVPAFDRLVTDTGFRNVLCLKVEKTVSFCMQNKTLLMVNVIECIIFRKIADKKKQSLPIFFTKFWIFSKFHKKLKYIFKLFQDFSKIFLKSPRIFLYFLTFT